MAVRREGNWPAGRYLLRPAASHFRRIALSSLDKAPLPAAYKQIYLPLWRYTADYERLYEAGHLPKRSANVAFTLQHLLEIVSQGTGMQFTRVFSETGTPVLGLGQVQETSALVLGTEEFAHRSTGKTLRKAAFKLPSIGVKPIEMSIRTNRQSFLSFPRLPKLPLSSRDPKVQFPRSESTLLMSTSSPAPQSTPPTPQSEALLIDLFTANQVKSLQRDYMRLRHSLLPLHMTDFPEQTSGSPSQSGLGGKKKAKFCALFAVYMQEAAPELRGKPAQLFAAILKGAGTDGEGLNWGQWLVINAVLVYRNAPESVTAAFIDKFTAFCKSKESELQLAAISVLSSLIPDLPASISPSTLHFQSFPLCSNSKND